MKAIVCEEYAPIDALQYREIEDPQPKLGEVRIAVRAVGVNYPDGLLVQGLYQAKPALPLIPGSEFSGVVESLGEGVQGVAVGDAVMALSLHYGAYAEMVCCPASRLMPLPQDMPFADASALVLAHGTAHHALKQRGALQPGETVLVLGAAGGTGLAAVQVAKAMGGRVIAACSSAEKLAVAKQHGADELINYKDTDLRKALKELTEGKGVDVVYDPVGGKAFGQCARAMAANGRLLVIGFASGDIPSLPVNLALVKEFSVVGVFWGAFTRREPATFADNMQQLFDWYQRGVVSVHIDQQMPLSQAKAALDAVMGRKVAGKMVLLPGA